MSRAVSDHAAEGDFHAPGCSLEGASEGQAPPGAGEGNGPAGDSRCSREGDAVAAIGCTPVGTTRLQPERTRLAVEHRVATERHACLTRERSLRRATHCPSPDQPAAASERGTAGSTRTAGLALAVSGVARAEAMVPATRGAISGGCDCGGAEECSECAKGRKRAAERVPHHVHRWSSGLRRGENRALTGGTNRRGISQAQPALTRYPRLGQLGLFDLCSTGQRSGHRPTMDARQRRKCRPLCERGAKVGRGDS
jgi:hypothetical protein